MLTTRSQLRIAVFAVLIAAPWTSAAESEFRVGVASVVITPDQPTWMAGYASRNKPVEGTTQDLFAKALAIEDAAGNVAVIVTSDLIGIPRELRDRVAEDAADRFGVKPQYLLLNASHTHCGPELRVARMHADGRDDDQIRRSAEYFESLHQKMVALIGAAMDNRAPARLSYAHAKAGFAMNRRTLTERGYVNSPNPDGPVDHAVPVLRVEDEKGKLRALMFGYACHNTTLSFYQYCGDYAGYAQEYLEAANPGVTALFLTGAGGDQNPYPRRTLELAQQHGRTLANAVEAALVPAPTPLRGPIRAALREVTLEFAPPPSRTELEERTRRSNKYEAAHAQRILMQMDEGNVTITYPYIAQVIRFGDDLTLVALAGEVVVDYSLRLKREINEPIVWVAGYSNDVFGYLPSLRVLREGGYEGGGAMRNTSFPGPFAESVEKRVVDTVFELVEEVGGTVRK